MTPSRAPLRQRLRPADDHGSALVEFSVLSLLMLVPVVYLVVVLGRLEAGAFAVQRAAREAGRVFVTADTDADGRTRGEAAAALAFGDHGFANAQHRLEITCGTTDCHRPDTRVEVTAALDVVLPAVPRGLDRVVPLHLQLTAHQVVAVDRFGAR